MIPHARSKEFAIFVFDILLNIYRILFVQTNSRCRIIQWSKRSRVTGKEIPVDARLMTRSRFTPKTVTIVIVYEDILLCIRSLWNEASSCVAILSFPLIGQINSFRLTSAHSEFVVLSRANARAHSISSEQRASLIRLLIFTKNILLSLVVLRPLGN